MKISKHQAPKTVKSPSGYPLLAPETFDASELLVWTLHLTTKTWMDMKRLHYFIEKVGKYKSLKIYDCK